MMGYLHGSINKLKIELSCFVFVSCKPLFDFGNANPYI